MILCGVYLLRTFKMFHGLMNNPVLNTKCVFWFSLQILSVTFLILRRTERDMIKHVYWSSCKVLSSDLKKLEFSRQIFEKYSNINFMLIRPLGTEFFHAGRRTDMKKRKVAFRNLAKASKNFTFCPHSALKNKKTNFVPCNAQWFVFHNGYSKCSLRGTKWVFK